MRTRLAAFAFGLSLCGHAFANEPGLEGRTDIYLQDGFESSTWYAAWGANSAPQNTSIVSDGTSYRGSSHLRVAVPAGEHYGSSFGFDFADQIGSEPDSAYFRYAIRLGSTWTTDGGGGGKLPGFGGTYGVAGWGGRPATGSDGWSSRGLFWDPPSNAASGDTRVGFYVYHADMQGQYGENWFWSGGTLGADGVLKRNQWYEIEVYVKVNTPAQNDGILRAWADGTQVYEKTDIRFRDVDTLKLERVWFDIYYGGSWTAPADMHIDFDNAVIAENPIGVVSDTPGSGGAGGASGGAGTSGASGTGGDGAAGGTTSGGSSGAAGNPASPSGSEGSEDDGGCGCRSVTSAPASGSAWFLLASVLAASLRSRRRARS